MTFWASWAFSETAFILFASLALLFSDRYLKSERRSTLVWAAVFTAMACLTRYSGIVLILAVLPLIALQRTPDLPDKLKRIGLYVVIGAAPLAMWLMRNYIVTGTLTGPRGTPKYGDFATQVGRGLSSVEAWNPLAVDVRALLLPVDVYAGRLIGAGLSGGVLLALAALVLWAFLRWRRGGDGRIACVTVAGTYAFLHIAFTIANAPSGYLLLDSRQFIPAYVPLVVVLVMAVDLLRSRRGEFVLPRWLNGAAVPGLSEGGARRAVRALPAIVVSVFAVCVIYAGLVSARDTYAAVFHPEFAWDAEAYNGYRIDIRATSLTQYLEDLVGDAQPIVRDHFDLYLADGSLIYFRENCDEQDMENGVRLRVEPANKLALTGIRKNFGLDILDFYPRRQGAIVDGKCLMLAPLPGYRIANISTGQYRDDLDKLWEVSFVPPDF